MTPELEALAVLAARVEALTGPDRNIDAEIGALMGLRIVEEGHPLGRVCYDSKHQAIALPSYTWSLDAAMTLIEPDEYWRLGNDGEGPDVAMFKATVTSHDDQAYLHFHDAVAATPALAFCAAALRAITPTQTHKGPHDE